MLGKLSWAAIPFNEPLPLLSGAVVGIVILATLVTVTVKGWWPYLWREWLTVDCKRMGIMYVARAAGRIAGPYFGVGTQRNTSRVCAGPCNLRDRPLRC